MIQLFFCQFTDCMDRWERFLNSLTTPGGSIFILVLIGISLGITTMFVAAHSQVYGPALVEMFSTLFGGFAGVLIRDLTQR